MGGSIIAAGRGTTSWPPPYSIRLHRHRSGVWEGGQVGGSDEFDGGEPFVAS